MLRSLLLAIDGTPSASSAADAAIDLARHHGAKVQALGIVNSVWIERPEAVPLGAMAFKDALNEEEMQKARERLRNVTRAVQSAAERAGMTGMEMTESAGAPRAVIAAEAIRHDMVIIARGSMFDVNGDRENVPTCVDEIIRHETRPVLLVPDNLRSKDNGSVLIAFDGSAAASRALHMFALLGLGRDRPVHVMTLEKTPEKAHELAGRAAALLSTHGVTQVHVVALDDSEAGTPAETILGLAKALDVSTIVMGAYGHRGFQEFFGSCTREVLRACPAQIFLHH